MASAALASQNESSWAQSGGGGGGGGGGYMGKIPSAAYMNPNPKKKQKQFHSSGNGNVNGRYESPAVTQTASDDAYSFNQRPANGVDSRNGFNYGGYTTIKVESLEKFEANELRKRLVFELDQIRSLRDRINSGQFSSTNKSQNPKVCGGKGSKKMGSIGSNKDLNKLSNGVGDPSVNFGMMKECRQILTKLMKHKDGWVFNVPVDDVALGLHDYHQIVKRPMDLGTVKANLSKKVYVSPVEFAGDVRLTFKNALLYNPKHDPVHGMAEGLLARFEELFKPIQDKIGGFRGDDVVGGSWNRAPNVERVEKPKLSPVVPTPAPKMSSMKKLEKVQSPSPSSASTPSYPPPPSVDQPPSMPVQPPLQTATGRVAKTKLPKPRAKDPDKREMSMEEKHKLGVGLQNLPQEKMPQLVQIIRKRNDHLAQDGDEIELDIEALDTETLWELDRFVTNWKKAVSKTNRQALLMNLNPGNAAAPAPSTSAADTDVGAAVSENNDSGKKPDERDDVDEDNVDIEDDTKKPNRGEDFDEDNVDIEDDTPITSYPPVEIEKDAAGGGGPEGNGNVGSDSSSSSSSGSDSSSSSDSGSGSSSGSDSDEDEAQS